MNDGRRPSDCKLLKSTFFERFFLLVHQKVREPTSIAFMNADWRDFQSTLALKENEDKAVTSLITTEYSPQKGGK